MPTEPKPGKTRCLKCRKPFQSRDLRTNRLCAPCADENSCTSEDPEELGVVFGMDGDSSAPGYRGSLSHNRWTR